MRKYGRNYALYIQEQASTFSPDSAVYNTPVLTESTPGYVLIKPPFTIEFDIRKTSMGNCNGASIRIYNLSKKNRNLIFQPYINSGSLKTIQLQAGYGDQIPVILNGEITEGFSVREGNNFITTVDCLDASFGFANSETNTTFDSGTTYGTIIQQLMKSIPGVKVGKIGDFPNTLKRQNAYNGSTVEILRYLSGNGFYVEDGVGYCLNQNEVIEGKIGIIDSSTGLLGTPTIEGGTQFVIVNMLFEPQIQIGQKLQIKSPDFNGLTGTDPNAIYKVIGVHHRGMISDSVCGDLVTTLQLVGGSDFDVVF